MGKQNFGEVQMAMEALVLTSDWRKVWSASCFHLLSALPLRTLVARTYFGSDQETEQRKAERAKRSREGDQKDAEWFEEWREASEGSVQDEKMATEDELAKDNTLDEPKVIRGKIGGLACSKIFIL